MAEAVVKDFVETLRFYSTQPDLEGLPQVLLTEAINEIEFYKAEVRRLRIELAKAGRH